MEEYLNKRVRENGLKYFCNKVLYGGKRINFKTHESKPQFRDIWDHYDAKVGIYAPSPSHESKPGSWRTYQVWKPKDRKFTIRIKESEHWDSELLKEIKLKRMPNRWVPELFEI